MGRKSVLVVEDNELNMKLVTGLLKIGKYGIMSAADAETGIEMARRDPPDLILMDIQLPGMDGLTATRIIKGDAALRRISVVALTSYAMQGDEDKAKKAGCVGYITKPLDTRNFLKYIAEYIVAET